MSCQRERWQSEIWKGSSKYATIIDFSILTFISVLLRLFISLSFCLFVSLSLCLLISLFLFLVNELTKREIAFRSGKSVADLTIPERMFSGACAGLCYWVGTFPLDAIKVRACLYKSVCLSSASSVSLSVSLPFLLCFSCVSFLFHSPVSSLLAILCLSVFLSLCLSAVSSLLCLSSVSRQLERLVITSCIFFCRFVFVCCSHLLLSSLLLRLSLLLFYHHNFYHYNYYCY